MDLSLYRCHDYKHLVQRWRKVARAAGVSLKVWGQASNYELLCLQPRGLKRGESPCIYLSAGIHGDEPAATEALIRWAEAEPEALRHCIIFPCLNPWGLVNNVRLNEDGVDLNRTFHLDTVEPIRALKAIIKDHRYVISICLHEDYDAQGLYIYEIEGTRPFWGEALLDCTRSMIPIENRLKIDGHRTLQPGLIRRKLRLESFPEHPEAIYLHRFHSQRSMTFETPSEFSMEMRVAALKELLRVSIQKAVEEKESKATELSEKKRGGE